MTDLVTRIRALVTRIRALADDPHTLLGEWHRDVPAALREAADALDAAHVKMLWHKADAKVAIDRAEKTEAEADALREAAKAFIDARGNDVNPCWNGLVQALSQPGPGAALRERVRKLEQEVDLLKSEGETLTIERDRWRKEADELRERVRKLEAVAAATRIYRDQVDYTGGDSLALFANEQRALDRALAALEEKP